MKSFIGPFLIAFSVILFVLVLQFLSKYIEDIVGKDIGSDVLGQVFLYASMTLVTLSLPLAVLLSSLLTMGNLGERYELAAMRSSGIGLFRIIRPLLMATLVVTGLSLYFSFYLTPIANLKLYTLLFDLSHVKPTFAVKEDHFYSGIDGLVIHVDEVDREKDLLFGIKVYDHAQSVGNTAVTIAEKGIMKPTPDKASLQITLFKGVMHQAGQKQPGVVQKEPYQRFYFDTLQYEVPLSGFKMEESNENVLNNHHFMLDIQELFQTVDSMSGRKEKFAGEMNDYIRKYVHADTLPSSSGRPEPSASPSPISKSAIQVTMKLKAEKSAAEWFPGVQPTELLDKAIQNTTAARNYTRIVRGRVESETEKQRKYEIEIHVRFMLPVSCIVFLFLGAPLGAIIRKGGIGMPVLISILFFILFYILMIQGRKLARDNHIEVWLGVWMPVLVMFPFALLFSYQSQTDSALLYHHNWYRIRKLLLGWLPKSKKIAEDRSTMSIEQLIALREKQKTDARKVIEDYSKDHQDSPRLDL